MKRIALNIILLFIVFSASAQNNTFGVYKTLQDYNAGKLTYSLSATSTKDKIKLHHFCERNYIDVIQNGTKTRLLKDSIFGFRSSTQEDYRFYKNNEKEYNILEKGNVIIYECNSIIRSSNGRVIKIQSNYFFSKTLGSPVLPLTVLNLKKAFPANLKFHDMLDLQFTRGNDVSAYYNEGKMYKVNYLLTQSNK